MLLWVGDFVVPGGDAAGIRVANLAKTARSLGLSVAQVGLPKPGAPSGQLPPDVYAVPLPGGAGNYLRSTTMDKIRELHGPDLKAIVAYNAPSAFLMTLRSYCRKNGLKLLGDVTEWYDPTHVNRGWLGPLAYDSELRMRLHKRLDGLIVISSALGEYYRPQGKPILVLPPQVDLSEPRWSGPRQRTRDGKFRLAYAGAPGKKELLGRVARAACGLPGIEKVEFHFAGFKPDALKSLPEWPIDASQPGWTVEAHGRMAHDEAISMVRDADFTLLVRPDKRFANYGFPTKLPESLAVGTPVFANPTSDIAKYVRDGEEGILLADESEASIREGLIRMLGMSEAQLGRMREKSHELAVRAFDVAGHAEPMAQFFDDVFGLGWRGW